MTDEIKADPTMVFFVQNWDSDSQQAQEGRQYMRDYDAIDPCEEIVPDLQHFYKHVKASMTSQESMMLDGETDEQVSDAISAWLNGLQ